MNLLDILTTGGIGSAIGAIAGIGEKLVLAKIQAAEKAAEREHIETMQQLQFQWDAKQAEFGLRAKLEEIDGRVWEKSFEHDSSVSDTSRWVNDVRALVRPVSIGACFVLTYLQPLVFAGYLGMMISWYFASRGRTQPPSH